MKNFKKLLYLTNRKERMEVVRLLTMILIMGLLDMIGVASILPLIMLLTDPAIIETNLILNLMFEFFKKFGIENSNQFLIVLVVTMFFLLVISISFKAITTYVQTRFVYMQEYNISKKDNNVWFGQLYGMSDHISFNLAAEGYNVAKYIPFGPVKDVMPYLIRRAEENTSVAGQTTRELSLIKKERKQRKL